MDKLNESALASVSMGYQVGVTALQMVTAVSSVANGGEMIEPRVVRAVYHDNRRYAVQPKVVRRTVTPETVATLTEIMEGVVDRGTARTAQIPGYTVAGKTGTAAKLVNGHYSTTDYNCSFVGFIPSRNPELAIIVVTDSPHAGLNTGGPVSGPVFKRIAEAALQYLGIGPTINPVGARARRSQQRRRAGADGWRSDTRQLRDRRTVRHGAEPRGTERARGGPPTRDAGIEPAAVGRRRSRLAESAGRHAHRTGRSLPSGARTSTRAPSRPVRPSHDLG